MDSLGDVWVSDGGNNRIQEFDTYGNYLSEFAVGGPSCIAIDSTNMWVVSRPDVLEYSIVVPEPSALALLAVSAIGLLELRMATATTGIGAANAKTMRGGPAKTPLSGVLRVDGRVLTSITTGGTMMVLTLRFLATTRVRNGLPMKIGKVDMPLRLWLFVVFFAGFPVVSVIGEIGPGRWANELQDALLGGHSGKLSVLAVMFLGIACSPALWSGQSASLPAVPELEYVRGKRN